METVAAGHGRHGMNTRGWTRPDYKSLLVLLTIPLSSPDGGTALPGMTEIVFRALSTLNVLSACRFPTLINSVNSL